MIDRIIPKLGAINIQSSSTKFLILIFSIVILSFAIDFFLSRSIFGRSYRVFVAPGVIVHELSHAVFCLLTGSKITKISLFDKEGGKVEHTSPKIPIIGQILISLAPFTIGLVVIFLLSREIGFKAADITFDRFSLRDTISVTKSIFSTLNFQDIRTWVIVYLVLSVAVTITPSSRDMRNISLSIILILFMIFLMFRYTSYHFDLSALISHQVILLLSTVFLLLIMALVLSIVVFVLSKVILRR